MKQQILVSLILLTPAFAYSMEKKSSSSSLSSFQSLVPSWLLGTKKDSTQKMFDLETNKNEFEKELQLSAASERNKRRMPMTVQLFGRQQIDTNPIFF